VNLESNEEFIFDIFGGPKPTNSDLRENNSVGVVGVELFMGGIGYYLLYNRYSITVGLQSESAGNVRIGLSGNFRTRLSDYAGLH
jgi:hypothetical protein